MRRDRRARYEGRLELFNELSVTVLKAVRPVIPHIFIECIRVFRDRPEIRVLRFFADVRSRTNLRPLLSCK